MTFIPFNQTGVLSSSLENFSMPGHWSLRMINNKYLCVTSLLHSFSLFSYIITLILIDNQHDHITFHMNTRKRTRSDSASGNADAKDTNTKSKQNKTEKKDKKSEQKEQNKTEWTSQKHSKEPQHNIGGEAAKEKAQAQVALLVVDVINDLNFEGNEYIVKQSKVIAPKIKALCDTCRERKVPVIYCNDNWNQWQSRLDNIIEHCTADSSQGKEMSKILIPTDDDYVVVKPKHSAFFSTTLDVLLNHLKVKTVIIVGLAANICVLFTANDAYMRDYAIIVPEDCTAANTDEEKQYAFKLMKDVLKAHVMKSTKIDWDGILKHSLYADESAITHRSKKHNVHD